MVTNIVLVGGRAAGLLHGGLAPRRGVHRHTADHEHSWNYLNYSSL